ncbi:glutathione S-transferase A-like [Branchiostoma floridae]|uniref:Glutathione S-transferase A-like n=1 Tax=Branchiostoma floridae TaxID=7739 RepID=A0A9J7HW41_BRAFL|nr:glutathione S-transferase A-like [Branchiostoma floridae]
MIPLYIEQVECYIPGGGKWDNDLSKKGLSGYNSKFLSFQKREHKTEEVLKINPRGQVPTFKHGDAVVNESLGVCLYLEVSKDVRCVKCCENTNCLTISPVRLQHGDSYIAGKDFTLADTSLFPMLAFVVRNQLPLKERFPCLASYYERLKERPSVKTSWPPHWQTTPAPDLMKDA